MSVDLNFEFEIYLLPKKSFGSFNQTSESWSGALNHVANGVAHIIAGPFTITHERSQHVDFSLPFLHSGYGLLIKQEKKGVDDLFMFMKPFSYLHWALIGLFAFGSAISLALLEFNSPFGLNPMGRQRARNYTLGSAISMVISLMFMHTMPAKSPKSWAGKWTQNFIASFALIFIATYTAQMASILSAGQDSKAFRGVDDAEVHQIPNNYINSNTKSDCMFVKVTKSEKRIFERQLHREPHVSQVERFLQVALSKLNAAKKRPRGGRICYVSGFWGNGVLSTRVVIFRIDWFIYRKD